MNNIWFNARFIIGSPDYFNDFAFGLLDAGTM